MFNLFLQFAENIGLAAILIFGLGVVIDRVAQRSPWMTQTVCGLLFGLLTMLFMSTPFEVLPGVIVDLRNLIIFVAGPFCGPVAALVAGALAGAYRFSLGGAGVYAGIGAAASAAALGCLVGWRYKALTNWKSAVIWGTVLLSITLPWALIIGDIGAGWRLTQRLVLPTAVFDIGGAVLLVALFMAGQRRRAAEKQLALNEQRFRDIAEMASDWFWEMDTNLKLVYVSRRLRAITGFPSEYFQGKQRRDLAARVSKADLAAHERLLQERRPFRDFQYALRTADGDIREVVISGKPLFDETGRFLGYRGSGRDVTDEIRVRQQMEDAKLDADLANKAKSNFLASMSHELRTPLNAVIGFSEIMKKELFGQHSIPSYRDYAGDINSSAQYLLSLVNDILDVARVESGQVELHKSDCDFVDIVDAALRMLQERAKRQGVTLTTDIEPGMPVACLDERAIKQVIVNVLTNAVKFTNTGGSICIAARFTPEEGYRITVTDTGVGIAADDLKSVLQPFHQASNTKHTTREGTGLGLPLSKALVEAHGGTFELASELGVGTTVRIDLPAETAVETGLPLAALEQPRKIA